MPTILKEKNEIVLHTTEKGTQQVKALFLEDERRISHLWIQRWSTKTDRPIGEQVALYGSQIPALMEFLNAIAKLEIPHSGTFNVNLDKLRLVHLPDADARKVLERNPELVAEFAKNRITSEDVVALAYRKQELKTFKEMLGQGDLYENEWQEFFERNKWIFGYGLAYVFTTGLNGEDLKGTIRGASRIKPGKEPDGIMKTRAAVSALCLVEIKKSSTPLLKKSTYRSGTWAPTAELTGAVAQSQENTRAALDELETHHRFTDSYGDPTGEEVMAIQPRSFLVVGNLNEFTSERGTNVPRFRSFEDYRRNLHQPEIITFDELYERARFIVESAETSENNKNPDEQGEDIPF